jgi:hypothetical protein
MIAYELKHSRADFMKDKKWPGYLNLCNELYFVVPGKGIIEKDELPAEVGLIEASKNGGRLFTRRCAAYRTIEPPVNLLLYLLMSRTVERSSAYCPAENGDWSDYWRAWLAEKEADQNLGHAVSRQIRKLIDTRVNQVGHENDRLKDENAKYAELAAWLEKQGLEITQWSPRQDLQRMREEVAAGFPVDLLHDAQRIHNQLGEFLTQVDTAAKKGGGRCK